MRIHLNKSLFCTSMSIFNREDIFERIQKYSNDFIFVQITCSCDECFGGNIKCTRSRGIYKGSSFGMLVNVFICNIQRSYCARVVCC